jgi:cytoskeletal protein CcmA (bactofilin family)
MAKDKGNPVAAAVYDGVISIIGAGMRVVGNCTTEGTLRIEGVLEGTVRAGKAVVVGKDGVVVGDIATQDAIVGGKVTGVVIAESRLELQATCVIDGEVHARRIKLDEGGSVNGQIRTGEVQQGLLDRKLSSAAGAIPQERVPVAAPAYVGRESPYEG